MVLYGLPIPINRIQDLTDTVGLVAAVVVPVGTTVVRIVTTGFLCTIGVPIN